MQCKAMQHSKALATAGAPPVDPPGQGFGLAVVVRAQARFDFAQSQRQGDLYG